MHLFPGKSSEMKIHVCRTLSDRVEAVDVSKLSVDDCVLGEGLGCSIPPECH